MSGISLRTNIVIHSMLRTMSSHYRHVALWEFYDRNAKLCCWWEIKVALQVLCRAVTCQGSVTSQSCKWLLGNCSKVQHMTSCKIGILSVFFSCCIKENEKLLMGGPFWSECRIFILGFSRAICYCMSLYLKEKTMSEVMHPIWAYLTGDPRRPGTDRRV